MAVVVTGGSSISLTYIAYERIIPGYVCHALFASLFSLKSCHLSLGDGALDIFTQVWWRYEFSKGCSGE